MKAKLHIYFVGEGKLDKESFIFNTLYPMVNHFIANLKEYDLDLLVKVAIEERHKREIGKSKFMQKFSEEIGNSSKEVRGLVIDFSQNHCAFVDDE